LYRVERIGSNLSPSVISAEDHELVIGGNRFDVPGVGVLYAASSAAGAIAESIAPFRPGVSNRNTLIAHDYRPTISEWQRKRVLIHFNPAADTQFFDIENAWNLARLNETLILNERGILDRPLDLSHLTGTNKRLTRIISSWIESQRNSAGQRMFDGIRFKSKLGSFECWGIFAPTRATVINQKPPSAWADDLRQVCKMFQFPGF
jgi:hypothetical protein